MQAASCLREGEYCRLIRVSVHDYCRLNTISFKVKFGSSLGRKGHSSSENLFRPSKRKDWFGAGFGVVSAEICKEVELPFFHFTRYSDRVCDPCGPKIGNLGQFQLVH